MHRLGLTGKEVEEAPKKSACWFCYQNCGVLVHVKDGIPLTVVGDPSHPISEGGRCPRNYAWSEFLYHPDRVNFPLKRQGKRGEQKWKRVTWDDAMLEISSKLSEIRKNYGAEALASSGGTNRTDDWARRRFFNLYGSPNVFHTDPICGMNCYVIETAIYGWIAEPSPIGSRLMVVWGHNPGTSYLPLMKHILDAKEQGSELMVIDPRFTETGSHADHWLQIRPGTDGALALAWINVIVNEGLYDKEFVENYTSGFEELRKHVQKYTPEWAARVTSIPISKIVESARRYATMKPATITWGVAPDHLGKSATPFIQSRAILRAITGNLDLPGGNPISGPHPDFVTDWELELNEKLLNKQKMKQLGSDRFKLLSWPGYELLSEQSIKYWGKALPAERTCQAHAPTVWRTIISGEPYPVKGLITLASNPMLSYANTKLVYEALKSDNLELHVVVDFWLTPTAELADYVLPAASWIERPVITSVFGTSPWFIANERAIQPLHERRTDYEFWRGIGTRLGQEKDWPWESLEDVNSYRISPLGYESYEEFVQQVRMHVAPRKNKKYIERGFGTPTGKVEIYSTILEKLGYNPLPVYEEPPESPISTPMLARKYPFILISGNSMPYHHSELRQIKLMREMAPEPLLEINPYDAKKLGITDGASVFIETDRGRVEMGASLNSGIKQKVVFAQKGWWFPEESGEDPNLHGVWKSNINICTDDDPDHCDPVCGNWLYRAMLCNVTKA